MFLVFCTSPHDALHLCEVSSKYLEGLQLTQGSKLTVASSKFAPWKFSLLPGQTVASTRGPWATIRSPEWHGHCRHADVMQHFSNPIIATNENIIIWTVLSFEEDYMGPDSQWSMIIWINYQSHFNRRINVKFWWNLAKWFLKNRDFIHVNIININQMMAILDFQSEQF